MYVCMKKSEKIVPELSPNISPYQVLCKVCYKVPYICLTRYHKTVSVAELYRIGDTIEIREQGGAGRMVYLLPSPQRTPSPEEGTDTEVHNVLNLFHSMGKFSRWQIDDIFSYFSQKIGFDMSCKVSPWEKYFNFL